VSNKRGRFSTIAVAAITVLSLVAAAGGGGRTMAAAEGERWTIALSNSFIGNQWRIEMVNIFRSACSTEPFASTVDCPIYNSGQDAAKQSQQISNLISEGVDAIVVNAASATGLNGVIKQACERGIVVVAFDNVPTEPCAAQVSADNAALGRLMAEYLVEQLGGEGNIMMVTGVAGAPADAARNEAAHAVFDANPGIEVVAEFPGEWDSATAQRNTTTQLPSTPDVDGVWVSAGTDGVIRAFEEADRELPVFAGESENGFRKYLAGVNGTQVRGLSTGMPPYLVVLALEYARQILDGEREPGALTIPFPEVTDETVVEGETVFAELPDSFYASFTDSGPDAAVELCVDAALVGTPCEGELTVTLPE
jgi:ribose transport system substrate-binding protein